MVKLPGILRVVNCGKEIFFAINHKINVLMFLYIFSINSVSASCKIQSCIQQSLSISRNFPSLMFVGYLNTPPLTETIHFSRGSLATKFIKIREFLTELLKTHILYFFTNARLVFEKIFWINYEHDRIEDFVILL